jgi:alkylation response protein AidB-like acyl-CoA dehydrogenase
MYFTDAHEELRLHVRRFLEKECVPHLEEWEEKTFPSSIFKRFGELGFLGLRYPPEYGGQGGDYFTAVVLSEEMAKAGLGGPRWQRRRCSSSATKSSGVVGSCRRSPATR